MNSSKKTSTFSFDELAQATFTTSPEADDLTTAFAGDRLALPGRNYAARLAIGRSLSVDEPPPLVTDTRGARAIRGQQLFGTGVDLRTWVSILIEHARMDNAGLEDIQDLVRRHWARGISLLNREWEQNEENHDKFILRLGELAGLPPGEGEGPGPVPGESAFTPKAQPVHLPLGPVSTDVSTSEPVTFALNAPGMSPHVALLGSLGTGKSRAAVHMLRELHRQAAGCPVLVFDMKGDLSRNAELVAGISARVIELPSTSIPLDVLFAGESPTEQSLFDVELRFRESFARIPEGGRLGDVQKASVGAAAQRALRGRKPVKLEDVHARLKEVYAENKKKEDTALTTFNDMSRLKLFSPDLAPDAFFSRSWILNLSALSKTARRLAAFLVLDAAYAFLKRRGDTPVDAVGNRALRLALFVDEAREVLAYQQESLIGLVRESRSQGGAVFMATQSPSDFSTGTENFLDNIGLGLCLKTNANPRELRHLLGQDQDLAGLDTGVAIARIGRAIRKVQLWSTGG
jgi:DNA sulfur modification protein DndE